MIYTYCITLSLPHSLPISPSGFPSFTRRKPSTVTLPIDQLARAGLFDTTRASARGLTETDPALVALRDAGDWPAFFKIAVAARKNILVSGATGSGKPTLAKALIQPIPPDERLLTIEATRELIERQSVVKGKRVSVLGDYGC